MDESRSRSAVSWPVVGATTLALQGALLFLGAAYSLYRTLVGAAESAAGAATTAGLGLICGVALVLLARGVSRRSRGARAPATVAEALLLAVGVPMVGSERWYVGAAIVASALIVLAAVLRPTPDEAI